VDQKHCLKNVGLRLINLSTDLSPISVSSHFFLLTLEELKTLLNSLGLPCRWESKSGRMEVVGEPKDRLSMLERLKSLLEK
jgi:hypothetical protein